MPVIAEAIPNLSDNYAWFLRDAATGATAIVDPADPEAIIAAIDARGGRLNAIWLTHHHGDHTAGTDAVRARYGAPVTGAAADAHRLPRLDHAVSEGDTVRLGETDAIVIDTPGHTVGHIALHLAPGGVLNGILLCGDTMFSLGCGRLLEGTAAQMFASLRRFAALPPETLVCCGHEYTESNARFALTVEPDNAALQAMAARVRDARARGEPTIPSRLADELAANPFLRAPTVERLAEIRAAKDRA